MYKFRHSPTVIFCVLNASLFLDSNENMLVTASHAIFVKERKRSKPEGILEAPVAVVGYQFDHSDLEIFIRNVVNEVIII